MVTLQFFSRVHRGNLQVGIMPVNSWQRFHCLPQPQKFVSFIKVMRMFCMRLAMATCSLGIRPYSCQ